MLRPLAQVQGFDLECFYYISSQDASTLGSEDASLLYLGSAGICEGTATDKICDRIAMQLQAHGFVDG